MPLVGLNTLSTMRRALQHTNFVGGEIIVTHIPQQTQQRGAIREILINERLKELVVRVHFAGERNLTPEGQPPSDWRRVVKPRYRFPLSGPQVISRLEKCQPGITFVSGDQTVSLIVPGLTQLKESELRP